MLHRLVLWILLACGSSPAWPDPAAPLPGTLPLRRGAESATDGSAWMPSLLLLGLALAGGGFVWWRRAASGVSGSAAARRAEHAITRRSSQALTPHASVHAVHWNGEEYLLACTSQQVTLIARRALPDGAGDGT